MARNTRSNNLTSPELVAQINPKNARLKKGFLRYLRSTQRSPGTIKGYENDLDIFFVYALQHLDNKHFTEVVKWDIAEFQDWLINDNGNQPARVRRIKATLQSLSNYIENILDDDPEYRNFRQIVKKIESPVNQKVMKKSVFSDEQLEGLLETLVELEQYEKACVLALAMYSGRRKAELVRFRVSDFEEKNLVCDGALYKTTDEIKTKGRGDGKYIHCYTLAKKFKPYLDLWVNYRAEHGIDSEWLFPLKSDMEEPLKQETLTSWAKTFSRMLGEPFYFHSMRHYFTTSMIRAGLPDSVVQEIIGWTSSDMVRIYNDMPAEEQIGMYFKNGDINVPASKGFDF